MDVTTITPSPAALKALAHPVRLQVLGTLRVEGPATATGLARRLGLNSGATSYHLRQLAQHGFVEEDEARGNARERWWRAAHQATTTGPPGRPRDDDEREALDAFLQSVAVLHTETLQRAVEERPLVSEAWREASEFSDWVYRLTPARARRVVDRLLEVMGDVEEDGDDAEEAGDFIVTLHAFPFPGFAGKEPRP